MRDFRLNRVTSLPRRLLPALLLLVTMPVGAQSPAAETGPAYRHSIDVSPLSPLFKIYAIDYCHRITPRSEIIVGPYYANIHYEDIGNTDAPGFIVGYRRYVWGKLHVDYQLIPQWDHFYEKNEDQRYPLGFDLWNEFRLGYTLDFRLGSLPMFINTQWPFGFALYSDDAAKPQSFKDHVEDHPFFYEALIVLVGIRW